MPVATPTKPQGVRVGGWGGRRGIEVWGGDKVGVGWWDGGKVESRMAGWGWVETKMAVAWDERASKMEERP